MERPFRPFHTGSDADLAFALVVLASYFSTFSILQSATTFELLLMIGFGVAYIAFGIYGYSYAVRGEQIALHLGYFAVQLALGGSIVFLGKGIGYNAMVLLPLAGHSVVLLPRFMRLTVNVAIVLTYALSLYLFTANWSAVWSGLPVFLAGQIFIVVFTQMAVNEERARAEVEQLVRKLEQANQRLRNYALQAEELAITKERNRLAREIHDGLGHYLTTIFMQIQAARAVMKAEPGRAHDALGTAQNMTQEALADVRRSVAALRDIPGESLSLQEEIERMLKGCEGSGMTPEFRVVGAPRSLPPQTMLAVYRAVQEGINNTCKHAHARRLSVVLDFSHKQVVRLAIQDDGIGAGRLDGGFGLLGMRERVNMLNGDISIVTSPGNGFRLEVCVPG
jgi:signal transduction histidine kinase